jgi:hypothetical protein
MLSAPFAPSDSDTQLDARNIQESAFTACRCLLALATCFGSQQPLSHWKKQSLVAQPKLLERRPRLHRKREHLGGPLSSVQTTKPGASPTRLVSRAALLEAAGTYGSGCPLQEYPQEEGAAQGGVKRQPRGQRGASAAELPS